MTSSDTAVRNAGVSNDIEIATSITDLLKNPNQLAAYLQTNQNNVYDTITAQKEDTFQKVYGDLQFGKTLHDATLHYNLKSREILGLHKNIYENQKDTVNSIIENKNTFGRKYEMNEWSVNNKKDTLFVFSSLFIMVCLFLLLTALLRLHYISAGVWGFTGAIGLIIFILIVINRAQYTDQLRDNKYWNKKRFEGQYGKIPVPSVCPTPAPVVATTRSGTNPAVIR